MGLFGGITKAVGGIVGGVLGSSASKSASSSASSAERAQLDFAKQQYEDWKNVYGPVQDNLSSYYSNLSPDYYETLGLENFELERNNAMDQMDTYLAQQGLVGSGIATQLKATADLTAASERAKIRRQAPQQVATDQMNFLSIGMNANPAPSVSSTLADQAAGARQRANAAASASGQAWNAATQSVGSVVETGLSSYFGDSK
jgi:hypothetical protein